MNETRRLARSPQLMSRDDSALLVVDVQEKLIPLIPGHERLVWNIRRLIDGAAVLGVAVAGTEQYPRGLGHTIAELRDRLGELPEKLLFSCGGCPELFERWRDAGIYKILLCGIESHVCVQQTAFDLLGEGFQVYLAVDAVGARFSIDHQTALRRMETAGASLTTTESALFEWCEAAGTPEFKQISALVR
ncbi:MAG: hydrolase, partial [Pirellulaceae bacterium]